MQKATVLSSSVLIVILSVCSFITVVEGLECYSCYDEDSTPALVLERYPFVGMSGHKSCKTGKIPSGSLKKPCAGDDDEQIKSVCAQLYIEATVNETAQIKLTARGCFQVNITIENLTEEDGCADRTYEDLLNFSHGIMKTGLEFGKEYVPPNTAGKFCHCNSDNCNAAIGLIGGARKIPLVLAVVALFHFTRIFN